jgi:hypothetical protein
MSETGVEFSDKTRRCRRHPSGSRSSTCKAWSVWGVKAQRWPEVRAAMQYETTKAS